MSVKLWNVKTNIFKCLLCPEKRKSLSAMELSGCEKNEEYGGKNIKYSRVPVFISRSVLRKPTVFRQFSSLVWKNAGKNVKLK
jgi:hypothetical protein